MNVTPILARFSISTSTILLGRRNSGIPYFSTPPISCSASNTVTSYPYLAISPAKDSPAGPEPITATLIPFSRLLQVRRFVRFLVRSRQQIFPGDQWLRLLCPFSDGYILIRIVFPADIHDRIRQAGHWSLSVFWLLQGILHVLCS